MRKIRIAQIFPTIENIESFKKKPTEGEWFLIRNLTENLSDEYEIYFQPFLNGSMPDIIIAKRNAGIAIIEVKDWNLSAYSLDVNNNWIVSKEQQKIKSPFQQVFNYKKTLFDIQLNALAEKRALNRDIFKMIDCYVYFHKSSQEDINTLYNEALRELRNKKNENTDGYKNGYIQYSNYEKQRKYLDHKTYQFNRDKKNALSFGNIITRIHNHLEQERSFFADDIYYEFRRYLKPPFHTSHKGIELEYNKKQSDLIISQPICQKIKGVAGSGKTTVLAKRAVNAHKRHNDKILILTYNKSLCNYIRDRISDVRENFDWNFFHICNYHLFIVQQVNTSSLYTGDEDSKINWNRVVSDEKLFDGHEYELDKYKTILVDEIQDYDPAWIKIIKKYFLSKDGEMVLFGDDSQNIYGHPIKVKKLNETIVSGFGRWKSLTESLRSKHGCKVLYLAADFQKKYILPKYDVDAIAHKDKYSQMYMFDTVTGWVCNDFDVGLDKIYNKIFEYIQQHETHPNDIVIIAKEVSLLRKLDQKIRDQTNEKTDTTFESEETYQELKNRNKNDTSVLDSRLEQIRKSKKFAFNANSGLLKLSTVHSFKGFESSTVIYIVTEYDNDEMVYTGITRSKKDLLAFVHKNSLYLSFFKNQGNMDFHAF